MHSPLPWLPVLCNIKPQRSDARQLRTNSLQRLLKIIPGQWPLQDDIFHPPQMRLKSRKPLWYNMQPIDITHCCCQDWSTTSVVNHGLICLCSRLQSATCTVVHLKLVQNRPGSTCILFEEVRSVIMPVLCLR